MKNYYSKTPNVISLLIGDKSYTLPKTHINYDQISNMLDGTDIDWEAIQKLASGNDCLLEYTGRNIKIRNGAFYYKAPSGKVINLAENIVVSRIVENFKKGVEFNSLLQFLDNVAENPSNTAIQELYLFLEDNSLPITPDGYFLAFKRITGDYKDCRTKTFDNRVGAIVEMRRDEVDDDRNRTCSNGLHFCAKGYLPYYNGSRIVVVKINPADVVSIPADYNNMKGRCCKYMVVAEVVADAEDLDKINLEDYINVIPANLIECEVEHDVEDETETETEKEEEMPVYVGTVKNFLKDTPKEARKVGKTYRLKTPLGTSEYEFVKTTGDRAFTKVKEIENAVEAKKVSKPVEKKVNEKFAKSVSNTFKKKTPSKPKVKIVEFKGSLKEFKRDYPKEDRKFGVFYKIVNANGSNLYQFVGTLGERGLQAISFGEIRSYETVEKALKALKQKDRKIGMRIDIGGNPYTFVDGIADDDLRKL